MNISLIIVTCALGQKGSNLFWLIWKIRRGTLSEATCQFQSCSEQKVSWNTVPGTSWWSCKQSLKLVNFLGLRKATFHFHFYTEYFQLLQPIFCCLLIHGINMKSKSFSMLLQIPWSIKNVLLPAISHCLRFIIFRYCQKKEQLIRTSHQGQN